MIWSLLFIAGVVYVGLSLSLYFFQERLIFFPSKDVLATPLTVGLDFEDVYLDAGESRIHGWYVPAENAQLSVLFCHGNAGNISHRLETLHIQVNHRAYIASLRLQFALQRELQMISARFRRLSAHGEVGFQSIGVESMARRDP